MKKKICIVQSTYNSSITDRMVKGAVQVLRFNKVNSIKIVRVPGSFEIPQLISKLMSKYDGFIAIGCIIKGETENFNLICSAITNGIMTLSINNKKPISNGLITSFNKKQAINRINNGKEAATAIVKFLKIK